MTQRRPESVQTCFDIGRIQARRHLSGEQGVVFIRQRSGLLTVEITQKPFKVER